MDRMINIQEKCIDEELKTSPTSVDSQVIEDQMKKSVQTCVSQRKRQKSVESHIDDEVQDNSKRYRTSYSQKQIELLERTYQSDRYVSRPQRAKLSIELNLPENTIKVWFQNRRMKEKRQALMLPTVAGKDPYLRETLLRVTQLYCATRYGSENHCPVNEITNEFQPKPANNKEFSSGIRKRMKTLSTPATQPTTTTFSTGDIHSNPILPRSLRKSSERDSSSHFTNRNQSKCSEIQQESTLNHSQFNRSSLNMVNGKTTSENEQEMPHFHTLQ
ncbi:unnamed protein product [Heterobilharzia americana]|nr:unnamed protein product [Heterobilharzia americana]